MFQTTLSCKPAISAKCAVRLAERLCFVGRAIHCLFCLALMIVLTDCDPATPGPAWSRRCASTLGPVGPAAVRPHPSNSLSAVGRSYRYPYSLPKYPYGCPLAECGSLSLAVAPKYPYSPPKYQFFPEYELANKGFLLHAKENWKSEGRKSSP